ncbi:hypothetical protein [Nitrospirillum sp. BR 11828]|uniref:hypothetical protein n=1 Tax=Nitrospirillum sp. BR 11828 TaxID=3104325 RepID=UPI002ACA0934|nr:hypothetical protein [Nitrospirillum sp. BR 11828]MDZ5650031.1 hypothetical protein [Nitrospirillum sp. BR 11828]
MTKHPSHVQGTADWFGMVGTVLCDAMNRGGAGKLPDWTLIERYVDGEPLPSGLTQGIRIDIRDGIATFRVGVVRHEYGDATIEVTASAARALNLLRNGDPRFDVVRAEAVRTGAMRVEGDLSPIATVLVATHDEIVDRTL